MRVLFMGTPDIATGCLQKLIDEKYDILGVVTQPDKPQNRGKKLGMPPVKELALKYDTTPSRVERAIRHAIEISWERGDMELMEDLFGHSVAFERSKPTNAEYLNTIADRMRLNNKLIVS